MVLIKKLTLAVFVSFAMLAAAPSAMAVGKIENATPAATVIAIDDTIALAEEALKSIQGGEIEKVDMMAAFKTLKQRAKTIESTTTYMLREKALGRLGKARRAYKRDKDQAEVEELMVKSLETFRQIKVRYDEFN